LYLKHNIPERQIVAKADIEETLARWTGMPIKVVREVSGNPKIEDLKSVVPKKKPSKKKP
jgi:hypothetical protein